MTSPSRFSLLAIAYAVTVIFLSPPDGTAQSFSNTGNLQVGVGYSTATLLPSGYYANSVAVIGGNEAGSYTNQATNTIQIYNTSGLDIDTFTLAEGLSFARAQHTATVLQDGDIFIAGGNNAFNPVSTTELLVSSTGGTLEGPNLLYPTIYGTAAVLLPSGNVLLTGGINSSGDAIANAEIYNATSKTISSAGSMTTARAFHTMTLLPDGDVLIAGGSTSAETPIASAEIYDPASGTFTATGSLSHGVYEHTATLLNDGTVLIAGGLETAISGGGNGTSSNIGQIYSPSTGTFTATTSEMANGPYNHSATLLTTGQVLIAGGNACINNYCPGNILPTATIYDPPSKTFTAVTSDMNISRASFGAALLGNGEVLIAGGYAPESNYFTNTAQLFSYVYKTSTNVAASPTTVNEGNSVQLTATVTSSVNNGDAGPTPTGTVNFYSGSTLLGSGNLNNSGVATYQASSNGIAPGVYPVTATYEGTLSFPSSTSAPQDVTVVAPTTTTSFTASPNPVSQGANITLSATVVANSGTAIPTGTVNFMYGSTVIATATLSGGTGSVPVATSPYAPGTYSITAQYTGNTSFDASASAAQNIVVHAP